MENEIFEVELELENGNTYNLSMQEVDTSDWEEIEKGKKEMITLVNGQQSLIEINSADWDGISFKLIGGDQSYFYDEDMIDSLLVEVSKDEF